MATSTTRPADSRQGASSTASLLRAIRHEIGSPMPEMAARLGISERTLSHYERGTREPPHPVVERYLEIAPHVEPAEILGVGAFAWPRARPQAWPSLCDALGYVVEEIVVESRRGASGAGHDTTTVRGVRPLDPELAVPSVLTALARACCDASPRSLRALTAPAPGDAVRFMDGHRRHEVRLHGGPPAQIECTSEANGPAAAHASPFVLHHDVLHPVERLVLRFDPGTAPPAGSRPALLAWPAAVGDDPTWDVAPALLPDAEVAVKGTAVEAIVRRPMPGLRCAVGWVDGDATSVRRPPVGATLGDRLRDLRESRGLSLREMAARLGGIGHVTVHGAERGLDVALETLRAVLRAFPDVAPHDLFPCAPPAAADPWRHARDAFGLCADEIVKRLRIGDDGHAAVTVRTARLRRLRPGGGGLELRHGGVLGVFQASPHALAAIDGAPDARIVRGQGGSHGPHHLFRFERHAVEGGLSFTVRNALSEVPQFSLLAERVDRDLGPGAHHEGTSHWVRFPCERLRIAVSLPRGVRPPRVVGHVCPWRIPPEVDLPRLSEALAAPVPLVRERHGALTLSISVDRPLVGFKYGLAWQLA